MGCGRKMGSRVRKATEWKIEARERVTVSLHNCRDWAPSLLVSHVISCRIMAKKQWGDTGVAAAGQSSGAQGARKQPSTT